MTKHLFAFLCLCSVAMAYDVVADGKADPKGVRDSTDAFLAAAKRTLDTYNAFDTADGRSGYSEPIKIPFGKYKISKEITGWAPMVVIQGEQSVIIQTENIRSFVFNTATRTQISGLQFAGGTNAIYLTNANVNGDQHKIEHCKFTSVTDYPIKTEKHLSAILNVNDCEFILCGGSLYNTCDFAHVRDCWVNGFRSTACFYSLRGRLNLTNVMMVPMGKIVAGKYWISTYSHTRCVNCVFSGEDGGSPIMKFNGLPTEMNEYPYVGAQLLFESCQLSGGPSNFAGSEIFRLEDKAMFQSLKFSNCLYMIDIPIITGVTTNNSLKNTIAAVTKKKMLSVTFDDCKVWPDVNVTAANARIPSEFFPYVKVR